MPSNCTVLGSLQAMMPAIRAQVISRPGVMWWQLNIFSVKRLACASVALALHLCCSVPYLYCNASGSTCSKYNALQVVLVLQDVPNLAELQEGQFLKWTRRHQIMQHIFTAGRSTQLMSVCQTALGHSCASSWTRTAQWQVAVHSL